MEFVIGLIIGLIIGAGILFFLNKGKVATSEIETEKNKAIQNAEEDFETRKQELIASLRKEFEAESNQKIAEQQTSYEATIEGLNFQLNELQAGGAHQESDPSMESPVDQQELEDAKNEIQSLKTQIAQLEETQTNLSDLQTQNSQLEQEKLELQQNYELELENQINSIREEYQAQLQEMSTTPSLEETSPQEQEIAEDQEENFVENAVQEVDSVVDSVLDSFSEDDEVEEEVGEAEEINAFADEEEDNSNRSFFEEANDGDDAFEASPELASESEMELADDGEELSFDSVESLGNEEDNSDISFFEEANDGDDAFEASPELASESEMELADDGEEFAFDEVQSFTSEEESDVALLEETDNVEDFSFDNQENDDSGVVLFESDDSDNSADADVSLFNEFESSNDDEFSFDSVESSASGEADVLMFDEGEENELSTDDLSALTDEDEDFSFTSLESDDDDNLMSLGDDNEEFNFDSLESSEPQLESFATDDALSSSDFELSGDNELDLNLELSDDSDGDELDLDSLVDDTDNLKTEINPFSGDDVNSDDDFDFGAFLDEESKEG